MLMHANLTAPNDGKLNDAIVRVAVLQRVCTGYRKNLFIRLGQKPGIQLRLYLGEDVPGTKVKSTSDLSGLDHVKLPTRFLRLRGRIMPWQRGLVKALADYQPDVILCEGESNFLNYLQALWYRKSHPGVRMIHWSLGGLPGRETAPDSLASRFTFFFQNKFDALLAYSSFGKKCLVQKGHSPSKIQVAVNVADSRMHMERADALPDSTFQAREKLGLPNRFTVLYCGAMDANKRPDVLVDMAGSDGGKNLNFAFLGDGPLLEPLRERIKTEKLDNVFMPGRVQEKLPLYYRGADVMVLPGRGGMVISEAMAWSLPVIVHQADGTEYDLIQQGETGLRLDRLEDLPGLLTQLSENPDQAYQWGLKGRKNLEARFTLEHMLDNMTAVIQAKEEGSRQGKKTQNSANSGDVLKVFVMAHPLRSAGGRTVGLNVIRAMIALRPEWHYYFLVPAGVGYEDICAQADNAHVHALPSMGALRRFFFDAFQMKDLVNNFAPDLVFSLANLGLSRPDFPQAVFVHQPHLFYPDKHYGPRTLFNILRHGLIKRKFARQLKNTALVFCQTKVIRDRLKSHYLYDGKIEVCGTSVSQEVLQPSRPEDAPPLLDQYQDRTRLIYLSRYYPHKNLEGLVNLYRNHKEELQDTVVFISIDGKQHPRAKAVLESIEKEGLQNWLVNLGEVPHEMVSHYYRGCDALLMPTLLETFGIPYLEAMACELPILTSDLDFAHEVCGNGALYFDPWNPKSMRDAILEMRQDPDLRKRLVQSGKLRLKETYPSWDEIGGRIVRQLKDL